MQGQNASQTSHTERMSAHCVHRVHKGLKANVARELFVNDIAVVVDVVVKKLVALSARLAKDDGIARRWWR